jgi:hypothetical protein
MLTKCTPPAHGANAHAARRDREQGWSTVESIWFMMVTSTTVGYGDLTPKSEMGRLFTCGYSLIGITVVLAAVAPFVKGILRARKVGARASRRAAP